MIKVVVEPTEGFAAGVEGAPVDVSAMAGLSPAVIGQIIKSLLSLIVTDPAKLAIINQIADWILALLPKS